MESLAGLTGGTIEACLLWPSAVSAWGEILPLLLAGSLWFLYATTAVYRGQNQSLDFYQLILGTQPLS